MDVSFDGVTLGESLAYQNIVSRRATFHYSELGEYLHAFLSDVARHEGTPRGACFYSLNNVPMDEMTDIEFFLPVTHGTPVMGDDLLFHTYFEVAPLARTVVTGHLEQRTEYAYAQLLAALESRELTINTPFFHVFPDDASPYVAVYLGYTDPTKTTTAMA